jgi:hypothetical protein
MSLRERTRPGLGLSPTTMPTVIDGTVIRGAHAATKNIKFQLTHLVWQFPDIKEIYPGSINVRLDRPVSPDHELRLHDPSDSMVGRRCNPSRTLSERDI